jgi:hypothetical protein
MDPTGLQGEEEEYKSLKSCRSCSVELWTSVVKGLGITVGSHQWLNVFDCDGGQWNIEGYPENRSGNPTYGKLMGIRNPNSSEVGGTLLFSWKFRSCDLGAEYGSQRGVGVINECDCLKAFVPKRKAPFAAPAKYKSITPKPAALNADGSMNYDKIGPNSNSVVGFLIWQCMKTPPPLPTPDGAVGWYDFVTTPTEVGDPKTGKVRPLVPYPPGK